jgi:hypothetical protein
MRGFEVPWCLRIIAQGFADLAHAHGKCGVGDADPGPDRPPELILGNQLAGMRDQIVKEMQGFGPQQHRLLSSPQRRVLNVQPKGTEDKHRLSPSGLRLLEMLEKFWNFRATRSPHNCYLVSK